VGLFAEAGAHLGPAQIGVAVDAGKAVNSCSAQSYFYIGPKAEFSGFGVDGILAGGIKASVAGGGQAEGGCAC
jgi:hypothetical protein